MEIEEGIWESLGLEKIRSLLRDVKYQNASSPILGRCLAFRVSRIMTRFLPVDLARFKTVRADDQDVVRLREFAAAWL